MSRYDDAYIHEKVKQHWGWVEKNVAQNKKTKKQVTFSIIR